ncbi:MAG: signal recognition particle protein [Proteobacteria bacterium]|nr:signal recognition particle protein [Pseudomonadota bacterium]NCA27702.1 signal recognition particle protein [Pseudomonadota bacterium]
MFDNFSQKITNIFSQISGKKFITEDDLNTTLRQIRIALLEADVSLNVAKNFIEQIKNEALGKKVISSVSAGQMIVKIVHDELVKLLGSDKCEIDFNHKSPIIILMVGLQGAGKTTTAGKLALRLKNKNHKKVLLASLDTYRPAASDQLKILGQKIGVEFAEFDASKRPEILAKQALQKAQDGGFDVLILDSAGRTSIDQEMMDELIKINQIVNAHEILLVVDAMIGQDAVNVANNFKQKLAISGVVLTRLDGDARGGSALTMKASTNCAIKFIGVGEKLEEFEEFNPSRIASRIVGMGDVVSLVEKAQEIFDVNELENVNKKLKRGVVDFDDILSQIRNMRKMGGMNSILNFLPGMGALKEQLKNMTHLEKEIKTQEAIILSMTKKERKNPEVLNSSRKHRIAKGAGSNIQEVNRLMKKYKMMQKMMSKFGKIDPRKMEEMMKNQQFN